MPSQTIRRQATETENAFLEQLLRNAATTGRRWMQGAENALVLWAASLLGLILLWLALAWIGRKFLALEFGLRSDAAVWVFGVGIPACTVYAVISSVGWIRGWQDYRPLLRADIDERKVDEEHYIFTEAKRFQEPEHGGLIYFLRTSEDKVMTLFDHESQDFGVQDADPLKSSFVPGENLVMVRAPRTRFVISQTFSGPSLDAGDPIELTADPKDWPETETYCDIPWTELRARLGTPAA